MVKIGLIKPSVFSDNFFKTVRIFLIVILDDQGDSTQNFSNFFIKISLLKTLTYQYLNALLPNFTIL